MEIFILWISLALLVGVVGKDRKIGFGMAFLWSLIFSPLIGVIIVLLSDKDKNAVHVYKLHIETAKKAEFKGQIHDAIDSYMNALYHLKNDYKRLNKKVDSERQRVIIQLETKVENLKQKVLNG